MKIWDSVYTCDSTETCNKVLLNRPHSKLGQLCALHLTVCAQCPTFEKLFTGAKVWRKAQKIGVGRKTEYEIDPRSSLYRLLYLWIRMRDVMKLNGRQPSGHQPRRHLRMTIFTGGLSKAELQNRVGQLWIVAPVLKNSLQIFQNNWFWNRMERFNNENNLSHMSKKQSPFVVFLTLFSLFLTYEIIPPTNFG